MYAASEADLPQRFYIDSDQEMFTDWKVAVADEKVLPVHSQALCLASKVLCGMVNSGLKPTEPISLPCLPAATMAQALALLRFVYDRESLTKENTRHLSLHGNLGGLLRLAHGLDCSYIFKVARKETCSLVTPQWNSSHPGFDCSPGVDSGDLVTFDLVKDIRNFAVDIKDESLQEACYNYLAKRCNKITNNAKDPVSETDSLSLVRDLSEYPDLLRAALYYMMRRKSSYTGKSIVRCIDNENYIPPALFTFKYQVIESVIKSKIEPVPDARNEGFCWNKHPYTSYIAMKDAKVYFYIKLGIDNDEPRPKVELKLRFVHWSEVSSSICKTQTYDFSSINDYLGSSFMKESEIAPFLDEDGYFYVQVLDVAVTETPANPPQAGANN